MTLPDFADCTPVEDFAPGDEPANGAPDSLEVEVDYVRADGSKIYASIEFDGFGDATIVWVGDEDGNEVELGDDEADAIAGKAWGW